MPVPRTHHLAWLGAPLWAALLGAQSMTLAANLVAPLNPVQAKAVVLFFVASDCPVSNRYFPEMERLSARFAAQAVLTRYVYANPYETAAGVGQHQAEYKAPQAEARLDTKAVLVHATGARTTPEAVLLLHEGATWRVAYRGRIDDRYVHIGLERAHAEHHDLENAVTAALAHQPVLPAGGPAVGCAIVTAEGTPTMRMGAK